MMNLNDLLVSYNQVRVPDVVVEDFEFPKLDQVIPTSQQQQTQEKKTPEKEETTYYISSTIKAPGFTPYRNKGKWASDLASSYRRAGITNENAIKMLIAQDALESGWGRSAQGRFNFGNLTTGSSWKGNYVTGNDHNAAGQPIKQKFRSYNSMDEYARDKVQFLQRLYDFNQNDDIATFTAKLGGKNKGKRKYAEAKNYATSLTKVFNSFKSGGVIKAQAGTIVSDNTRVVKPVIQEKIQRTYSAQQPQFIQDNRSNWERQQYSNYRNQQEENKGLYKNQHLWNWSAPFNSTRLTRDNTKAVFDFNKSAGMSSFAIGTGITSPVTTATSMVGSIVGAGIGNEIAGERGSIVGGLVGGLIGFGTRRARNNSKKLGRDYTERLIKLLGKRKDVVTGEVQYNDLTRAFAKYLKKQRVDISKFSNRDLYNLMSDRYFSVIHNLPNKKAATLSINETSKDKKYGFTLYNKDGKELGNLSLSGRKDKSLDADNIESTRIQKGVSQDLYDTAIRYSKQLGGKGIVSGKVLLSPEQTYSIWNKYPNKKIISYTGEHTFNSGKYVNKNGERYKIYDGPVVRLQSPSKQEEIPVKSSNIFHPSMIDKETGELNPPNWNDKNILKLGTPLIWLPQNDYDYGRN